MAPRALAQSKIAVVDMQRALNETEDGRAAKAKLGELFKQRQKALDDKQNALKAMKENLEKQRNVLSRDVLQVKMEEYQKLFVDLQGVYMEYQRELQAKEGDLTKGIVLRMQNILRRIGQKEGYALIIERNEAGVIFVPTNFDLTDLVIQKYNAGEGREEIPKETKKPDKVSSPKPKAK
jgi:outer membrane protein